MSHFSLLLSSLKIRKWIIPNRVFISAHSYGYADKNGLSSDIMHHYVVERAKGGVGMIVLGATAVDKQGWHGNGYALNDSDRIIPFYQTLSNAVHNYGTIIIDQLFHTGGQLNSDETLSVWGPSEIYHPRTISMPLELTVTQIESLVISYAEAAKRVLQGGLDGIEIAGTQGFLIDQFISPKYNKRHDKYGGSLINRMRFLIEVCERIRNITGSELMLGYRLTADSLEEGGTTLIDGIEIAQYLNKNNLVDFINVSGGTNSNLTGYWINHGDMSVPLSTFADLAGEIRKNTDLPIFLASKIKHPEQGEFLLEMGYADMIAMTRAHIADPSIIEKTKTGRVDEIRPCISCNQACVGGNFKRTGVKCVLNPAAGREYLIGNADKISSSEKKKNIVIIGAGPAGLEFARTAALRGHNVNIYDKNFALGGQLLVASIPLNRREYEDAIKYYEKELLRLRVKINLGIFVTINLIEQLNPDVLVVATGSKERIPDILCTDNSKTISGWAALRSQKDIGRNIIIVDADWRQHALSLAEHLMLQGKKVELISSDIQIGKGLDITNIASFLYRLLPKGLILTLMTEVSEIREQDVVLRHTITQELSTRKNIDQVVFVVPPRPNRDIWINESKFEKVIWIGECNYQRGLDNVIYHAHIAARDI